MKKKNNYFGHDFGLRYKRGTGLLMCAYEILNYINENVKKIHA